MRNITLILVLLLCTHVLFAQEADEQEFQTEEQLIIAEEPQAVAAEQADEQEESQTGITTASSLNLQISSLPEAKLGFTQSFVFPFLQGQSPLTRDNNVNLALTAEVSPISMNGIIDVVWTPVAFFEFELGGRAGSGWNINLGGPVYGIGINQEEASDPVTGISSGKAENDGSPFDGLLWAANAGGAIQMDLAALVPGDWNHVLFRTYHEINYKGYSRAKNDQSWYFEDDFGENCNGFNYRGNLLLGYQMPKSPVFNLIALQAEGELFLYDNILPGRDKWGDEKIRWTFSAIYNFSITKQFNITLIGQLRTMRNYTEQDWKDLYYRNRTIDKSSPLRLEPYRVAAALTYKF